VIVRLSALAALLPAIWSLGAIAAPLLDQPSNAEATAAYRAIPAIAADNTPSQMQTAAIKSCKAAVGQPGVLCTTSVKKTPSAPPQDITIHFARGPDSAWVATVEQRAP